MIPLELPPGPTTTSDTRIAAERSRIHARMARTAAPGQMVFALFAALVLADHLSQVGMGVVLALLGFLSLTMWLAAARLMRMEPEDSRLDTARLGITLIAMATALVAGISAASVLHQLPDVTRLVLTVSVIAAYAVAVAAHHPNPPTLLGVGLGMVGPVALAWVANGTVDEVMIASALLGLVLMAWYISLIAGGAIDDAIRARLRVAELSLRLEARSRDLEAAVRAKTQFLAAASHDLRQPVTSLNLLLGGLSDESGGPHPELGGPGSAPASQVGVAALAARMQPAVQAMGTILDSMLEMSRLEAGLVRANLAPVDLRDLLLSIQIEYTPQAQASQLQLTTDIGAMAIATDRDLLGRILRNLVDNALKYTPSGSVQIGATLENGVCRISVQDTGLGIPTDLHDRVFDDYFQAGNPNRDRGMGLGLGLSIVKRMVALLGGAISLQSQPGVGSTFTINLPTSLTERHAPSPVAIEMTLAAALAGKTRLLVVDDDPLIRDAFDVILSGQKINWKVAANPNEALALVDKTNFAVDVAVVDYRLPGGLDGLQVLESLIHRNRTLAAVLITGDLDPGLVQRAAAIFAAIVNKPFTAGQLALGVGMARQLASARTTELSAGLAYPDLTSDDSEPTRRS